MDYVIVFGSTSTTDRLVDFYKQIKEYLAQGFVPTGGIAFDDKGYMYQAMFKK